jgi:hypothetical protein
MARVVVTAQVEDLAKWEQGFRTHGDLFRTMAIISPVRYATTEGNHVAVYGDTTDLTAWMKVLNSPATAEAMAFDGVKRETVKVFVLDKELAI